MSGIEEIELELKKQALEKNLQNYFFYKQQEEGNVKTELPERIKNKIKKGIAKPLL